MKDAATFSWQQFAVNLSGDSGAQLIERGFVPGRQRRAGVAVSIVDMNSDAPHDGEMHPDGDEVIYVLEGQFSLRLGVDDPVYLDVATGQGVVIPKGVWRKIHIVAPCRLVTVTPGPGFEYKT